MTTEYLVILFAVLWLGTLACWIIDHRNQHRAAQSLNGRLVDAVSYQSETIKAQGEAFNTLKAQLYASAQIRFMQEEAIEKLTVTNDNLRAGLQRALRETWTEPED